MGTLSPFHWFMVLCVCGTSIWVLIDAMSILQKDGLKGKIAGTGPWTWFFACLFLWIFIFPFYLVKRHAYKKINSSAPQQTEKKQPSLGSDSITLLEKLAQLKEKGLVTDEEFAKKKKELLG